MKEEQEGYKYVLPSDFKSLPEETQRDIEQELNEVRTERDNGSLEFKDAKVCIMTDMNGNGATFHASPGNKRPKLVRQQLQEWLEVI